MVGRGSVVDQQHAARLHLGGGSLPDCLLQAEVVRDLRMVLALQGSPSGGNTAAVGTDDQAFHGELFEVTPDGERGNLEHASEVVNAQLRLHGPQERDYLRLSANRLHGF